MKCLRWLPLSLFLIGTVSWWVHAQSSLDQSIERTPNGEWRLSWRSEANSEYTLQRSTDLKTWVDVSTLTAKSDVTSFIDADAEDIGVTMWRILGPDGSETDPIRLSDIQPTLATGRNDSGTSLGIKIDTDEPIASVVYFNGDQALGSASPSLGGVWNFNLEWDRTRPRVAQLSVEVTTESGVSVRTPSNGVLIADPNKFVALKPKVARQVTDGLAAELDSFIEANPDGSLGAFLFFPEGQGDPTTTSGAHFAFAAGSTIEEAADRFAVEFTTADYFRGHVDTQPLASRAGSHQLFIDGISPSEVNQAFTVLAGRNVPILFGALELDWIAGNLGSEGWAGLTLGPPIPDIILPSTQSITRVSTDPKTGEAFLVLCFHGAWSPLPGGNNTTFRVPQADPLKVYLSSTGQIAAQGTVDVVFPDNATLRGSVSWQPPNFEISVEGKGFTIPALSSLQARVPTNPAACAPTSASPSELDRAAECLLAYRNVYRTVALSGLKQTTSENTTDYLPAATPSNTTGSVLEGWAWRLQSWESDRSGEVLTVEELQQLTSAISGAADTANASQDLTMVLKVLRDFLILKNSIGQAVPTISADVDATLIRAEASFFAAAERLSQEATAIDMEIVSLLVEEIAALAEASTVEQLAVGNVLQAGDGNTAQQVTIIVTRLVDGPGFLLVIDDQRKLLRDMSVQEVLRFMTVVRARERILARAGTRFGEETTLLEQAKAQARMAFFDKQNVAAEEALQSNNYYQIRQVLLDRGRFFDLQLQLHPNSVPLNSNTSSFQPSTSTVADAFKSKRQQLSVGTRLKHCALDWDIVNAIAEFTIDHGEDSGLYQGIIDLHACNDLINARSGIDKRCNDLALELGSKGFPVGDFENGDEGTFNQDVSGRYQSIPSSETPNTFQTLQLNQGGRYITGAVQEMTVGTFSQGRQDLYTLRGMLVGQQTTGVVTSTFAYRLTSDDPQSTPEFGLLSVTGEDDDLTALLSSETLGDLQFQIASRKPIFSDSVISQFDPAFQDAIGTSQRRPLHTVLVSRLNQRALALRSLIRAWWDSGLADEDTRATAIDVEIGRLLRLPTINQRPLIRALVSQRLSAESDTFPTAKISGLQVQKASVNRSYWDALSTLFLVTGQSMPNTQTLLGIAQNDAVKKAAYKTAGEFEYTIKIKTKTVSVLVGAESFIEATITKRQLPDGEPVTFPKYEGTMLGLTLGKGGPGGAVVSEINGKVVSQFSWNVEHFTGELGMHQFGINFVLPEGGVSFVPFGSMEIIGTGAFPPLTFPLETSSAAGLSIGLGVDLLEGFMSPVSLGGPDIGSPLFGKDLSFKADAEATFEDAVFFETNSAVLSDCAWQILRELVGEHRALFESPELDVAIEGFTDTVGTDQHNNELSLARATAIRDALLILIGLDLRVNEERLVPRGLGEGPARQACNGCDNVDDPLFRRTDITIDGLVIASIRNRRL